MPDAQGPQPGDSTDPYIGFDYAIEIAGVVHAYFQECSGMAANVEVFEYKEGGQNDYSHKLPGRVTYSNITLKKGLTDSTEMWDWFVAFTTTKNKAGQRKSVSVVQLDSLRNQLYRWDLGEAYPVKWTGPSYNATQSGVTVEQFELAFTTLTAVKV